MQKHTTKKTILFLSLFFCSISIVFSQTYVNKEWSVNAGNPLMLQWSNSLTTSSGLITVGNTQVAGQGANILLTKYTSTGGISWSVNYNTGGTKNDYGTNLVRDASGNIYVCGMTDNNGLSNYDIVVLKYNSSGTLLWDTTYNSPSGMNDLATGILVDPSNNIYVAGSSEGSTTQFDFITLKYNSSGVYQWASRYNYANLQDYGGGITLNSTNTYLFVTGASASSANNWDYTTVKYDLSGTQVSVVRNSVAGSGYDQPYAYAKDNAGNMYITGKGSTNGTDYDIKTIKLTPALVIDWDKSFDKAGLADVGNAIGVDNSSNILVGGYTTNSSNQKEAKLIKYNNSGTVLWTYERHSDFSTGNAEVKAIDIDGSNNVYICVENQSYASKDIVIIKLSASGRFVWERRMEKIIDEIPTSLKVDNNGDIFVTYTQNLGVSNIYTVEKFSQHEVDTTVVYDTLGNPMYMKNELLITFNKNIIDTNAVNNTIGNAIIDYNDLSYFIDSTSYSIIYNKLIANCPLADGKCYIKAAKLFPHLQTGLTSTINRRGERIKVPVFWNAFRVFFPSGTNMSLVLDSLNTIPEIAIMSEPNYIIQPHVGAIDTEYPNQYGLFTNGVYPNADINIEPAWDYTTGKPHIKTGVFDGGLNYEHPDFMGWSANNNTKVRGAWDFKTNSYLQPTNELSFPYHGTNCAGIIGALRNRVSNSVAGIAGGNNSGSYDVGTSLYAARILNLTNGIGSPPIHHVYDAIVMSSIDSAALPYCWGLHIMNNSWGFPLDYIVVDSDSNRFLLTKSVHFANRANVTFVASRGNAGNQFPVYPANIDDDWVISVSGSDTLGEHDVDASYGLETDIIAPYRASMTISTTGTNSYGNFGSGTSVSAPYVSGVAALLLSYMNDTIPNYKNLAPEDVEQIIQLTATDVENTGYDIYSGWGRLNGGKALQWVSKPDNEILHFGTNPNFTYTKSFLLDSSFSVITDNWYINDAGTYFKPDTYLLDAYRINAHVTHSLPANDTIVKYWGRPSSSSVLDTYYDYYQINTHLQPRERVRIDTITDTYADLYGYCYRVKDTLGNTIAWWPRDTTDINQWATFEYSILVHNKFAVPNSIQQVDDKDNLISLYPNPTGNEQTIAFNSHIGDRIHIGLYDMSGRFLRTVHDAKSSARHTKVIFDISNLLSGMYFYKIDINSNAYYLKTIKQ